MSPDESIEALAGRVATLERSNRRLTIAICIFSAVFAAIIVAGAADNRPQAGDMLRVSGLEVLDESGQVRARLDVDKREGPGLALFDSNGTLRQRFYIAYDSIPRLAFFDRDGTLRELMGVSLDGAAVKLFDESATMRAIMGLYMDGSTGLVLLDESSRVRAGVCLDENGEPSIELFNDKGESVYAAP